MILLYNIQIFSSISKIYSFIIFLLIKIQEFIMKQKCKYLQWLNGTKKSCVWEICASGRVSSCACAEHMLTRAADWHPSQRELGHLSRSPPSWVTPTHLFNRRNQATLITFIAGEITKGLTDSWASVGISERYDMNCTVFSVSIYLHV